MGILNKVTCALTRIADTLITLCVCMCVCVCVQWCIYAPQRGIKFSCDLYLKVQSTILRRGAKGCGGERESEDYDCVRHGSRRRRRHRHRRCRRPLPHITVIRRADNGEITWRSEVISSNYFRAECHEMKPKFDVVAVPLPPAISLSLLLKVSLS